VICDRPGRRPEIPRHAAIDDEVVAVDVGGIGAEEERDDVGHVLGRRDAPERDERVALGEIRGSAYTLGP
jgi:hypothetical protein